MHQLRLTNPNNLRLSIQPVVLKFANYAIIIRPTLDPGDYPAVLARPLPLPIRSAVDADVVLSGFARRGRVPFGPIAVPAGSCQ
ncbi:hypothetical protein QLX08_009367 [Tetragonisca angustula]|uniref:Water stress and hypersensitive response domain-containing protein n=1 Tax=Tetragonisca angustula TaxID=166442 RepID=A0AAW0ZG43_9HYME